jgi:DNA invertase Pin-like site-specific DNA recombinase
MRYPDVRINVESYSGVKERPIFNELMDKLSNDDTLIVTKLDRFCRTTKEGLGYIDSLMSKGVKIHILNMGLIEDTPMGRLIVTNLLAFAEFERTMIIERTQSGKIIAKSKPDFREGRPKIYGKKQIEHALKLLETNSYKQVEKITGISKSTLIRAKRCY